MRILGVNYVVVYEIGLLYTIQVKVPSFFLFVRSGNLSNLPCNLHFLSTNEKGLHVYRENVSYFS